MTKRIMALMLLIALVAIPAYAADGVQSGEIPVVPAVEGNVTISLDTDASEGDFVMIFILPEIIENGEVVTADKVAQINTQAELSALNVEYVTVVKAGTNGLVEHNCVMKSSLQTGICNVVFSFLGSDEVYVAGRFEHVRQEDIDGLVRSFNQAESYTGYPAIIDKDINGEFEEDGVTRKTAKEILRKSSADVTYYTSLADKEEFCQVLYSFKQGENFTLPTLVAKFNESAVWMRLRHESDTLSVLNTYNGEGSGKYWNLELGEGSDFSTLSDEEKTKILTSVKTARYTKAVDLEKGFTDNLVLSLFRGQSTRTSLENLIKADGKYGAYFADVRTIIANANLSNEYELAELYNNVLENGANSHCTKFDALGSEGSVEALFKNSIPESTPGGTGDSTDTDTEIMGSNGTGISNGGSGGGGGGGIKKDPVKENEDKAPSQGSASTPFADVSETHWANEYIAKLYKSGAINGVSETAFNPAGSVQRQDFVKILIGALGTKLSENKSQFLDVPGGAYYESYVMTALENGFISGTGDGSFGVGSNLKREDAAVIMARVLDSYGVTTLQMGKTFNDDAQVAPYAKDAIKKVSAAGIFGGDNLGNFNPKGSLTRAEACAILCRLADAVKEV